jgi:hypothetical protein
MRTLLWTLIAFVASVGEITVMAQSEAVKPFGTTPSLETLGIYEKAFSKNLLDPSFENGTWLRDYYSILDLDELRVMKSFPGKAVSIDAAWELTLVNALTSNRDVGSITSEFLGFVQAKCGYSFDEALIGKITCASSRSRKSGLYFSSIENPPLDVALESKSGSEISARLPSQNEDGFVECKTNDNNVWRICLNCPSEWNRPMEGEDNFPFCVGHSLSFDQRHMLLIACFDRGIVLFEIDCIDGTCVFGRAFRNKLRIRAEIEPSHKNPRPGLKDESGGLEGGSDDN